MFANHSLSRGAGVLKRGNSSMKRSRLRKAGKLVLNPDSNASLIHPDLWEGQAKQEEFLAEAFSNRHTTFPIYCS